jgi:hypothetical protein
VRVGPPLRFPPGKHQARELRAFTDEVMQALADLLPAAYRGFYAK